MPWYVQKQQDLLAIFIAMESLVKNKRKHISMFASNEQLNYKWGKARSGPSFDVPNLIRDNKFGAIVEKIFKVFEPLVKLLCLVNSNDKPTINEVMDWAKQAIQENCRYPQEYLKIINARWNEQLHHPQHVAGNIILQLMVNNFMILLIFFNLCSYAHSSFFNVGYFINPDFYYRNVEHHSSTLDTGMRVG